MRLPGAGSYICSWPLRFAGPALNAEDLGATLTSSATGPRTPTNSDSRCFWLWGPSTLTPLTAMLNIEEDVMLVEAEVAVAREPPPVTAPTSGRNFEAEIIGILLSCVYVQAARRVLSC